MLCVCRLQRSKQSMPQGLLPPSTNLSTRRHNFWPWAPHFYERMFGLQPNQDRGNGCKPYTILCRQLHISVHGNAFQTHPRRCHWPKNGQQAIFRYDWGYDGSLCLWDVGGKWSNCRPSKGLGAYLRKNEAAKCLTRSLKICVWCQLGKFIGLHGGRGIESQLGIAQCDRVNEVTDQWGAVFKWTHGSCTCSLKSRCISFKFFE